MRPGRIRLGAVLAILGIAAACASSAPHLFGEANTFAPRVTPQKGERTPQHLTISLGRPANVAVYLVRPGVGSQLLFPVDSTDNEYMEAGSHMITTAFRPFVDSLRRPTNIPTNPNQRRARDSSIGFSTFGQHGFLLVFASQQKLPFAALRHVTTLSLPAFDDESLNAVTKLIKESAQLIGPWGAAAFDYPP